MKAHKANLINSLILITLGFWGAYPFIIHQTGSATSLIPIIFGILLLLLNPGLKKECKIRSHIVVLLTILILLSLFMPLKGSIERSDTTAIIRIGIMMLSSLFATVTFIKSFIDARKQKS